MKLSICTDVFGKIPFTEMLDKVVAYGLDAIEMTAGGWGGCNFIPSAEELINDDAKREEFLAEITKRGLAISALNCSGNPLIDTPMGRMHSKTMRDTMVLAGRMGVDTVVTMSGLPAGAPGDKTPNWFVSTISWPEYEGFNYMAEGVKYQWKVAGDNQLCEAVGEDSDVLGLNLDPSHLMIQGAEPIEAAWALGEKIFYVHGKDARIEKHNASIDGILENLPVECSAQRNWNYVAVGCGRDLQWWKEFFSVCHMNGYNGYVSLEMEDLTMSVEAGLQTSIDALKATISQ